MTFTDDDLKRLKDEDFDTSSVLAMTQLDRLIKACIARLEAAENVIHAHTRLEKEEVSYDYFVTLLNQWRKAAGR